MNSGQLKDMLADIGDDLPVLVKTAGGWKHISLAYEEILWSEKDVPGNELEAFCLELIDPEEEMKPYYVGTWENTIAVYKKTQTEDILISIFLRSHPHDKEAAEAECSRLNAEHRKEQK